MSKIVATYLVRVTLHEHNQRTIADWQASTERSHGIDPIPDLASIVAMVHDGVYDGTEYFRHNDIGVTAERVDE